MSCIGPQSPAWVAGLLPDATYTSPHDHFGGIRDVSLALSQLWLLAEPFRASLSFRYVFDSLFTVGEQDKTSTHAFCLPVLFVLR